MSEMPELRRERLAARLSACPMVFVGHVPDVKRVLELSDIDPDGVLPALIGTDGAFKLIARWYAEDVSMLLALLGYRIEAVLPGEIEKGRS